MCVERYLTHPLESMHFPHTQKCRGELFVVISQPHLEPSIEETRSACVQIVERHNTKTAMGKLPPYSTRHRPAIPAQWDPFVEYQVDWLPATVQSLNVGTINKIQIIQITSQNQITSQTRSEAKCWFAMSFASLKAVSSSFVISLLIEISLIS